MNLSILLLLSLSLSLSLCFVDVASFETINNYEVISIHPDPHKLIIQCKYKGVETYYKNPTNPILSLLAIEISFQSRQELRVLIKDPSSIRWEIPEKDPYPHDNQSYYIYNEASSLYKVEIEAKPFSFKVIRQSTKEILFNTQYFTFICSDRFFEFSSILPTKEIFGLGERVHKLKLQIPGVYTIWNRDLPIVIDDGETGAKNTYGLFPLYLMREKKRFFHLVYLRNSNGMDIFLNKTIIKDNKGELTQSNTITYRITGGVLDLKFFIGAVRGSPEEAIRLYHVYIGGYFLQPFWSFGYHQCRWGYMNLSMLNQTLSQYHSYGMPLDGIWMDIDYMVEHALFTIDEKRFNLTLLDSLLNQEYKKRLVLIIDPGVAVKKDYVALTEGIKRDIFIKDKEGNPLLTCVWPGQTYFPDFMNPKTQNYWSDMFDILYDKVKFSGIWLDMNELSNFVDGEVGPGECGKVSENESLLKNEKNKKTLEILQDYEIKNLTIDKIYEEALKTMQLENSVRDADYKCGYEPLDYFYVYNPGNTKLDHKTLCLNGKHDDGEIEYNLHNFNGFFESLNTFNYLKERLNHSQPFILSRSTVPGSGKYTMHWTGDNVSTYKWMKLSIAGLINFNIFGIANVGADICGFSGDTTEELCSRWMQLGSLYPFSRNHNTLGAIDQDPFAFGGTLIETSMKSLKLRYSLLKYYYYLFVRNHGIGTVIRPLFFEFPEEKINYNDEILDEEFLLGSDLLVTPVLDQGVIYIKPYFPGKKSFWYDINTGRRFRGGQKHFVRNRLNETVPLFIRDGGSVYRQNVTMVNRTDDLGNTFYFSVALNKDREANGQIMACEDYGNSEKVNKCINGDCLLNANFKLMNKGAKGFNIRFTGNSNRNQYDTIYISGVEIYGADRDFRWRKKEVMVEKVNAFKDKKDISSRIGLVEKIGRIVRVNFRENLPVGANDVIFIKF